MYRTLEKKLLAWRQQSPKKGRKPLLLHGARQVGKTHLLQELGRQAFEHVVYLNFETDPAMAALFQDDITPQHLVHDIELMTQTPVVPGKTLLIFDEIQASERALTSLKYFCEMMPELHVAAAGSLLGITIHREHSSFPVGKVQSMYLYPLDFEEFLLACGEAELVREIRAHARTLAAFPEVLHQKALTLYHDYLVVGGMPEVVQNYTQQHFRDIAGVQQEILDNYTSDMAKYAVPADAVKISACYRSLPAQLAKENHKFQYRVVQHGGRAATFAAAIDWLITAGIVLPCMKVKAGELPLRAFEDTSSFKLYSSDVGLLVQQAGIPKELILKDLPNLYLGAVTENYVAQSLRAQGNDLFYWTSDQTAELDFLLQCGMDIIPIEVKKGTKVRSRSLDVYRKKYDVTKAIQFSERNFGLEGQLISLPLYAAFALEDSLGIA